MSPRSTPSELPFARFALGQAVYAQDLQSVVENLNHAGANNPEHLAASQIQGNSVVMAFGASLVEWYSFRVWVDDGLQTIRFAARASVPSAATGTVTITVGADTQTLDFVGETDPDDVETVDLDVSDTGTGLLEVTISTELTTGVIAAGVLAWSLFGLPIDDVDLPAPPDE